MYFIEKLLKIFLKPQKKKTDYNPQNIENCKHIFMPIDSTGEYLACTKCGKLIRKDEQR